MGGFCYLLLQRLQDLVGVHGHARLLRGVLRAHHQGAVAASLLSAPGGLSARKNTSRSPSHSPYHPQDTMILYSVMRHRSTRTMHTTLARTSSPRLRVGRALTARCRGNARMGPSVVMARRVRRHALAVSEAPVGGKPPTRKRAEALTLYTIGSVARLSGWKACLPPPISPTLRSWRGCRGASDHHRRLRNPSLTRIGCRDTRTQETRRCQRYARRTRSFNVGEAVG